jgi:hypothetical protein
LAHSPLYGQRVHKTGTVTRHTATQILVEVEGVEKRFKAGYGGYDEVGSRGLGSFSIDTPDDVRAAQKVAAVQAREEKRQQMEARAAVRTANMARVRELLGDAAPHWVQGEATVHADLSGVWGGDSYDRLNADQLVKWLEAAVANATKGA